MMNKVEINVIVLMIWFYLAIYSVKSSKNDDINFLFESQLKALEHIHKLNRNQNFLLKYTENELRQKAGRGKNKDRYK